jgi:predicted acylesterase/phospholipase RssA
VCSTACLKKKPLHFEGISGTSAGAANAVVLTDGFAAGGREGARKALRGYWQKVSDLWSRGPFKPPLIGGANSDFGLENSPGFRFIEPMTHFASPYQLNPSPSLNQTRWDLNSDYSDRLLEDWIDENKLDKARILFAAAREFAGALGRLHIWQAQRQAGHTQGRRRLAVSLPNRGSRLRAP